MRVQVTPGAGAGGKQKWEIAGAGRVAAPTLFSPHMCPVWPLGGEV